MRFAEVHYDFPNELHDSLKLHSFDSVLDIHSDDVGVAVTIVEARKLAMEGKTVISPGGIEYTDTYFIDGAVDFTNENVFGEWREKREARRIFKIESEGVIISGCWYNQKPALELTDVERWVEFVEVLK